MATAEIERELTLAGIIWFLGAIGVIGGLFWSTLGSLGLYDRGATFRAVVVLSSGVILSVGGLLCLFCWPLVRGWWGI